MALKRLELMLPAHVSPVKQYCRAAMNGTKDNTNRQKWLFRGLHSVFVHSWIILLGPWFAL